MNEWNDTLFVRTTKVVVDVLDVHLSATTSHSSKKQINVFSFGRRRIYLITNRALKHDQQHQGKDGIVPIFIKAPE